MSDFRPGLEGVIAFETEIAEPDKEGGTLRYRGVDIEDLVGRYPFENVWGLVVDGDINSPLPAAEKIELQDPSGSVPADLQAALATLGPKWGLKKLVDIDPVEARDPEKYVRDILDRGERIMGFGHRVYRAYDPRARVLKRTAEELGSPRVEVAAELEEAALKVLREKSPDRQLETNVEYWAAIVLDVAEIPADLTPAMFGCARVAGWSAHILEQKRTGRLIRPAARYIGPGPRTVDEL